MIQILVVEDDVRLNKIICRYLSEAGYHPVACTNAEMAYEQLEKTELDLIISDIMMPDIDGYEFAGVVRRQDAHIPILFVTALEDFSAKKKGFQIGVDDIMIKPLDMEELLLRVGALLRRAKVQNANVLEIGKLRLVQDEMAVYLNEEELAISPREFYVLYKLLSHPKKIFTRSDLIDEHWGMNADSGLRTIDVYITKLRKTFAECDEFKIVTVHGFGYKAVIE